MRYKLIAKPSSNNSPVQQILQNRGIAAKDIERYLKTTDDVLLDPTKLDNLKRGAACLIQHISKGNKVFIQVDSDCDGYVSSATFINYLYKQFPDFVLKNLDIRVHTGKEHGVVLDAVLGRGYSLVIVPDAGSNQYEEHKILKDNFIDVIVLDHHEAEKQSPDAIVINNQLCDYENKTLSGVGVVYKFCSYIDSLLKTNDAENLLDLTALGLIADMMDVKSFETRHLIQKGLANIQNPFFKGLVERQAYSLGQHITPIGVAFYIAPLINATIRVGTQEEKETMFKAMLSHMAYDLVPSTKRGCKGQQETIVEQAVRNATNIRNRQKKYRDEGLDFAEKLIEEKNLNSHKIIAVEVNDTLDKNLTGLIANQLMAKYQKPILIVRPTDNDTLQGSARGYDKSELKNLKEYLVSTDLVEYAEGHANAMGVGVKKDNLQRLIEKADEDLKAVDFTALYDVDFIYEYNNFKAQDIIDIGSMKSLWGKGVDEAMIAVEGVKVKKDNLTLMSPGKNPTIKITLPNGVSIIKFGSSKEEYESLLSDGYIEIDVVGTCAINEWMGNISGQILVKDYEIKSKHEYYF